MRSRRGTVVVLLALIALAGGAWLAWRASETPVPTRTTAVARATPSPAASTASAAASEATPRERLAAAREQLRRLPAQGCSLPLATWSPGRPASGASDVEASEAMARTSGYAAFRASVARIDVALRSGPDAYSRAVGVWLNLPRGEGDEGAVSADDRTRQLVALAVSSNDPRVYSLAFPVCRKSEDSSCLALSARRWAEADAGNAEPWAYLLVDAIHAGDLSGQEEALFHIAQSTRVDLRTQVPIAAILQAAGEDGDPTAVYALSTMTFGMVAAQAEPIFSVASRCRSQARTDANRAQLCARIADQLFEHSDNGDGRMVGADITWQITGDRTRLDRHAAETALVNAQFEDVVPATCDQLRARNRLIEDVAFHGWRSALHTIQVAASAVSAASR